MSANILDVPGLMSPEEKQKDGIAQSIFIVEGLLFAVHNSQVPARFVKEIDKGMQFLLQMHQELSSKLTIDELSEYRKKYGVNIPPPTVAKPAESSTGAA